MHHPKDAVDGYLALCEGDGRKPDVRLKGSFNLRPGRDRHRCAMVHARRKRPNLNTLVSGALRRYVDRENQLAWRGFVDVAPPASP